MQGRRDEALATEGRWTLHLFGHASDLDRVELLFTSLLLQATHGVVRAPSRSLSASGVAADRRAWLAGFTTAVHERLTTAETEAVQAAGSSTDLVLVSRTALVEQAGDDYYGKTQTRKRTLRGSGYSSGHAAGIRADLGTGHVGGNTQRREI